MYDIFDLMMWLKPHIHTVHLLLMCLPGPCHSHIKEHFLSQVRGLLTAGEVEAMELGHDEELAAVLLEGEVAQHLEHGGHLLIAPVCRRSQMSSKQFYSKRR